MAPPHVHTRAAALILALSVEVTCALHPRPQYDQYASYARWLVHESDYAVVSTHHGGSEVFGNIISISDGDGYNHSTGAIYTYLPDLDATYADLMVDNRIALAFSEMALAGGSSGGCQGSTAENPPCGRLTISGRLTRVPSDQEELALRYLYARHPVMKGWDAAHHFHPFWIAPENISSFFVINFYGGSQNPSVAEYLAAPWYRNDTSAGDVICSTCGHIYDAKKDGNGKAFEELPDSWTCPVCGAPKSAYKKQKVGGRTQWVHNEVDVESEGEEVHV